MQETIDMTWKILREESSKLHEKYDHIHFEEERYQNYKNLFMEYYNNIINEHMYDTEKLDTHKVAAIIIVSCIESEMIVCDEEQRGQICIATEIIALTVALSFMNIKLNKRLNKTKVEMLRYSMPIAFACQTPYHEIMCRLLYLRKKEGFSTLCVLELSDKLFLLEYLTIIKENINPILLKK